MDQKGSFLAQLCRYSEKSLRKEDEDYLVQVIETYATYCVDESKELKANTSDEFKKILKAQEMAFDFIKEYVYVFDEEISKEKMSDFAKGMVFTVNSKQRVLGLLASYLLQIPLLLEKRCNAIIFLFTYEVYVKISKQSKRESRDEKTWQLMRVLKKFLTRLITVYNGSLNFERIRNMIAHNGFGLIEVRDVEISELSIVICEIASFLSANECLLKG